MSEKPKVLKVTSENRCPYSVCLVIVFANKLITENNYVFFLLDKKEKKIHYLQHTFVEEASIINMSHPFCN